jgi:hypothetical protein
MIRLTPRGASIGSSHAGSRPRNQEPGYGRQLAASHYKQILQGRDIELAPEQLCTLQAAALDLAQSVFTNQFGTDTELKRQLGYKQGTMRGHSRSHDFSAEVVGGQRDVEKMRNSLSFILRSFTRPSDVLLRAAAIDKLAEIGSLQEIAVILPHVRKGTARDIEAGLSAIGCITDRCGGVPVKRGGLEHDPRIGKLLKKSSLSPEQRNELVEAVLTRGTVAKVKQHGGFNMNPVYFVTFKETLPDGKGGRQPIRGVWKPERGYPGKNKSFFTREVAAYEFDKQFARTGMVPPTVECVLSTSGSGRAEVGSMQWMIPDAQPIGKAPKHLMELHQFHPKFDQFRKTRTYREQESKLRTLLFVFNDPDKLANNVFRRPNLQNIMVTPDDKIWVIDNGYAMGAPPKRVNSPLLPALPDPELVEHLSLAPAGEIVDALSPLIGEGDAEMVAAKSKRAAEVLEKRL